MYCKMQTTKHKKTYDTERAEVRSSLGDATDSPTLGTAPNTFLLFYQDNYSPLFKGNF